MTLANVSRRTTLQAGLTLADRAPRRRRPLPRQLQRNRSNANMALTTQLGQDLPAEQPGGAPEGDLQEPVRHHAWPPTCTSRRAGGAGKLPALVLSGPFGAVKEQVAGLYAQTLAERGFVTLAFDPSFTGESGGAVRNVASPEFFTEDFSAAVDYVGLLPNVDRERIGAIGICGLSGMALTAASGDSRIKAVATASMYDMSRSISRSYKDSYTREQRHKVIDYLSQQRWADAEKGTYALGYHEVPFDKNGQIVKGNRVLPERLPADADPVLAAFFNYYRTPRGYHAGPSTPRPRGPPRRPCRSSSSPWPRTST